MVRLGGDFDGLNRVPGLPRVESPGQSRCRESQLPQLVRHTDAGGLVLSMTVGDDHPVFGLIGGPLGCMVRQDPDAAGDFCPVALVV